MTEPSWSDFDIEAMAQAVFARDEGEAGVLEMMRFGHHRPPEEFRAAVVKRVGELRAR